MTLRYVERGRINWMHAAFIMHPCFLLRVNVDELNEHVDLPKLKSISADTCSFMEAQSVVWESK